MIYYKMLKSNIDPENSYSQIQDGIKSLISSHGLEVFDDKIYVQEIAKDLGISCEVRSYLTKTMSVYP